MEPKKPLKENLEIAEAKKSLADIMCNEKSRSSYGGRGKVDIYGVVLVDIFVETDIGKFIKELLVNALENMRAPACKTMAEAAAKKGYVLYGEDDHEAFAEGEEPLEMKNIESAEFYISKEVFKRLQHHFKSPGLGK